MSGYQESFVPISHLAQAAGIRDAVMKYYQDEQYGHWYCCATETIVPKGEKRGPFGAPQQLFVCLAGERSPYVRAGSWMLDDNSFRVEDYTAYFNDLDEYIVDAAASKRPDVRESAYNDWMDYLKHVWD